MKVGEQLGKHVERISMWANPVGDLIELNDGSFIAVGYAALAYFENLAALRALDIGWQRPWNAMGGARGEMGRFVEDFYGQETNDRELVDVIILADGSAIAIGDGLIFHADRNRVDHIAEDFPLLVEYYLEGDQPAVAERKSIEVAADPEPFFEWTRHERDHGVEYNARRGPLSVIVFEDGNHKIGTPIEPGAPFLASGVFHWGYETGEFCGADATQAGAVANAKMIVEGIAVAKIAPLYNALMRHIETFDDAARAVVDMATEEETSELEL